MCFKNFQIIAESLCNTITSCVKEYQLKFIESDSKRKYCFPNTDIEFYKRKLISDNNTGLKNKKTFQ